MNKTFSQVISEIIKKEGDLFVLYSHDGSRVLGRAKTRKAIEKRERQVQFFKHLNK
jgi:predicted CopG family antitoxin